MTMSPKPLSQKNYDDFINKVTQLSIILVSQALVLDTQLMTFQTENPIFPTNLCAIFNIHLYFYFKIFAVKIS